MNMFYLEWISYLYALVLTQKFDYNREILLLYKDYETTLCDLNVIESDDYYDKIESNYENEEKFKVLFEFSQSIIKLECHINAINKTCFDSSILSEELSSIIEE